MAEYSVLQRVSYFWDFISSSLEFCEKEDQAVGKSLRQKNGGAFKDSVEEQKPKRINI